MEEEVSPSKGFLCLPYSKTDWQTKSVQPPGAKVHRYQDLGPSHSGMCVAISFLAPATPFIHVPCMDLRAEGEAGKLVLSPFGARKTFLPGMISVLTQ